MRRRAAAAGGATRNAGAHAPPPGRPPVRSASLASDTARRGGPRPTPRPPPPAPTPGPAAAPAPALPPPTLLTTFPTHLQLATLSNGLLLLDKPLHWSTGEVVAAVQRAVQPPGVPDAVRRVASVAALDPAATGLMLLAFGAATRMAARVEAAPKRYTGALRLGGAALSYDAAGGSFVADALPWAHLTDDDLQEAADSMVSITTSSRSSSSSGNSNSSNSGGGGEDGGDGGACPPPSSVHVLPPRYKLAQQPSSSRYSEEDSGPPGIQALPLRIHEFQVWREPPSSGAGAAAAVPGVSAPPGRAPASVAADATDSVVHFSLTVTGRAHVRSLVAMYGRRLRTCACLQELRRTRVAEYDVADAWALDALLPLLQRYGKGER